MKKVLFLFAFLAAFCCCADAQIVVGKTLIIAGKKVTSISNDTTDVNKRSDALITEFAAKRYADLVSGGDSVLFKTVYQSYLDSVIATYLLSLKAPLASPALTGNATAPTQTADDNSTKIATTAYADAIKNLMKLKSDSIVSTGYATQYDLTKSRDSLQAIIDLNVAQIALRKLNSDSSGATVGYTTKYQNLLNLKYSDTVQTYYGDVRFTSYVGTTTYGGNVVQYRPGYNNSVDINDAIAFGAGTGTLSFLRDASTLSVERREGIPNKVDTLFVRTHGSGSYTIKLLFTSWKKGARAVLKDLVLATTTDVTAYLESGAEYAFNITNTGATTARFQLLITPAPPVSSTPYYTNRNLNLKAEFKINDVSGTAGQTVVSQGPGVAPVWGAVVTDSLKRNIADTVAAGGTASNYDLTKTKDSLQANIDSKGTVASFYAIDGITELFYPVVTNPTTTPQLSFSQSFAPAYSFLGRAASSGLYTWISTGMDSNYIPALHSENYYNTKYLKITDTAIVFKQKVDTGFNYLKTITLTNTGVLHNVPTYTYNAATHNFDMTQTLASQSAYKLFGRASGSGTPSFNSIDSNYFAGQFQTQVRAAQTTGAVTSDSATYVTKGSDQTITGAKTFNNGSLLMRNVANTFNGSFTNTNTANRIYTLPNVSSTIAILGDNTFTGVQTVSANGALSAPAITGTGTWITGGTATTTKPYLLIEPTGTASTAWNVNGTGLGVNAPSGFTGRSLDLLLDGVSQFSISSYGAIILGGSSISISSPQLYYWNIGQSNATGGLVFQGGGNVINNTSGNARFISVTPSFVPSSGTGTLSSLYVNPIVNQTGGASGITRGVLVEPTLTSAADFRAIEFTNNTQKGLWGTGTAASSLAGTLRVGGGTAAASVASAALEVVSTTQGFLQTRSTTSQRTSISSPAVGLSTYDTDLKQPNYHDGVSWKAQVGMTFGTSVPSITPAAIGNFFLDTTNKKLYTATGTASSADWTILN